jgi:hypothetical protein
VEPDREIDIWFMVRPPERLMVVHDDELPDTMSAVYLMALVCLSNATTLKPLIAT